MDRLPARNAAELMREEMVVRDDLINLLLDGPKTIPEIASALVHPTNEIVHWMMAMWKYGVVEDTGKADRTGYYQYRLKK